MKPRLFVVAFMCLFLVSCERHLSFYDIVERYIWYALFGFALIIILYRWTKKEPEKELDAIHQHHYHHFSDLQLSSADFYDTLTAIITEREFPNVKCSRVTMSTGGYFDPRRTYLEVKGDEQVFYVCAAPFGKNFFISYWLRDVPEGCGEVFLRKVFGLEPGKKTFYQIDSAAMFMESIKSAVLQAIEAATTERGLRKLSPDELIPKRS